jgi:predicted GIY-YIG superfamily endonuclease
MTSSQKMRKAQKKKGPRKPPWCLYLLECGDGSFYTGITNHLPRRLERHQQGKASRYTRSRLPVKLLYQEACRNHSHALKREWAVKSLSRTEKEILLKKKCSLKNLF